MRLFVGDDWTEDHHDIEVMELVGAHLPGEDAEVVVGIETNRGPWVPGRTGR